MSDIVNYLYLIPLSLSMLLSIRAFRNHWETAYRLFCIFLIMTFFTEIFAILWKFFLHKTKYWDHTKSNLWIYNIYLVPQYLFYFSFFSNIINDKFFKDIKHLIISIYVLLGFINIIFIQGIDQLNTYTIIPGGFLIIACSFYYFILEFNKDEQFSSTKNPSFWIVLGSFIFHTVSLPYFIAINYLSRTNIQLSITLFNILLVLNILMYSFYVIAFLCKNPLLRKSY